MNRLVWLIVCLIALSACDSTGNATTSRDPDVGRPATAPRPARSTSSEADTPANAPPADEAPAEEERPAEQEPPAAQPVAVVQSDGLNVRTGPSPDYAIITTVVNGTELPALGFNADQSWVQVLLDGTTPGWVNANYVQLSGAEVLGTVEAPVLAAPLPPVEQNIAPASQSSSVSQPNSAAPPAAPPSSAGGYSGSYDPFGPDVDCDHFGTHAQAQAFYIAAGGPSSDPHRLDRDNDGSACETLP